MMIKLRPELSDADSTTPVMSNGTAYLMIASAVRDQHGLVHGRLHMGSAHCAIGSYFNVNARTGLPVALINEVAAVNDSVPKATRRQRKLYVLRWLRWKLVQLGMPGYTAPRPVAKRVGK